MADRPLHRLSIHELSQGIYSGKISPVKLTEHFLSRIFDLDEALHAFTLVLRERALAQAHAAEKAIRGGGILGPLHGIPYAAKDLYDVTGVPTRAGSTVLEGKPAQENSAATQRLAEAGMILLGKTNTVEFAYGGAGINHITGTPHNPWHRTHHVPGGSSSGSGVAVGSGMAPMALGTDTGGSVRIPAALNGVTGLKTTVGRISRHGVFPLSYSLDSVGPLTRTVEDAALVFTALQGRDARDDSTQGVEPADVMTGLKGGARGLRIAFAETLFWEGVDDDTVSAVREAGKVFESLGAAVTSIELPQAPEAIKLNKGGGVIAAEAYAIHRERLAEHGDKFDPIVASRIRMGEKIGAADYIQTVRDWKRLRAEAMHTLADTDVLLVPTTQIPARPVEQVDSSIESYLEQNLMYLRNTYVGNILNFCGLSVPCGFSSGGLPIGMMIYAKPFDEALVLRAGYAFQQATDWHLQSPELAWAGEDRAPGA